MGLLDGKVAIVTGAGGGIGRCHALALAREGAKVVVNDLGGSRDGMGQTASMAEQVVDEIRALGGDALSNHDSVTDSAGCARMVEAAVARWGRLDIVVNNAGILRDKTFAKLSESDWDIVVAVHLTGTRNMVRAALEPLQRHGGAIINTTSYSGMIGNFGQSNYAAAKAGIYGLTRVLALELRKFGITANCVAPIAKTRMTEDIAMVEADWRPEQISPMVVFLASDLAKSVTGQVFGIQGQRINVYEVKTSEGVEKPGTALWTAEELAEKLPQIVSFDAAVPAPAASGEDLVTQVFSHFPAGFKAGAVPGWKATLHWVVKGATHQTVVIDEAGARVAVGLQGAASCTVKTDQATLIAMFKGEIEPAKAFMSGKATADNMGDLMKMAMAFDFSKVAAAFGGAAPPAAPVAAVAPEAKPAEIPIGKRYEGGYWLVKADDFQAYARATDDANSNYFGAEAIAPPMFHVRPFIALMMKMATDPELDLDLLRLVHGEHAARFHRSLRHGDILNLRGVLQSLEEKSSGKVATFQLFGFVDGAVAVEAKTTYFIRGKKKEESGEKKVPPPVDEAPPAPDYTVGQGITEDQPGRYAAASGDENPIHLDPATARAAGLPGVIAHGLCTMALAQRDLIDRACGGDPRRLAALSVRWARPVLPGQALTLQVWNDGAHARFQTVNAEGQPVVTHGRAEIR
jgi:NAD(P)-dependent dehydrogenase (short-subunit alcohol dehydrogenase family)/acyl dehydratase/putative sterol carrier protein